MHVLRVVLLATLLNLVVAASAQAATLTLSKQSTPPLTTISASGTGFAAGETVDLAFDGAKPPTGRESSCARPGRSSATARPTSG